MADNERQGADDASHGAHDEVTDCVLRIIDEECIIARRGKRYGILPREDLYEEQ